jgi:hypothetical protein
MICRKEPETVLWETENFRLGLPPSSIHGRSVHFSEADLNGNHTHYFSKLKSDTTFGGWSGLFPVTQKNIN